MDTIHATRLAFFFGIFAAMALFEIFAPGRPLAHGRKNRWFTSWSLVVLDSILVRIVFPLGGVGIAYWATQESIGLFNWIEIPLWLAGVISFLVLDWSIWFTHVLSHKIPFLWRFHRVHHADPDMDVTTAIRFHPIEILLSMGWKTILIIALGAPPLAVLIFEIVLNGGALFNHTNIRLPGLLEKAVRLLIVTPDMHRVHHSQRMVETDSNYGFSLSVWDRLFGTYTDQPRDGHENMKIGLETIEGEKAEKLIFSLSIPFRHIRESRRDPTPDTKSNWQSDNN